MAKSKNKKKTNSKQELDSVYILKMILYIVLGSQWLWLVNMELTKQIPIPIGLIVGLLFASHDHFQIDRKVEYAMLLIASLIGFWSNVGLLVTILK